MPLRDYLDTLLNYSKYIDSKRKYLNKIILFCILAAILEIIFPVLLGFGAGYIFNDSSADGILQSLEYFSLSQTQTYGLISLSLILFGLVRYFGLVIYFRAKYDFAMQYGYKIAELTEYTFLDLDLLSRRKSSNSDLARIVHSETNTITWKFFVPMVDLFHEVILIFISLVVLAYINIFLFIFTIPLLVLIYFYYVLFRGGTPEFNEDDVQYREKLAIFSEIIQQGSLDTVSQANKSWLKQKISSIFIKISSIQQNLIMDALKPRPKVETVILISLGSLIIFLNLNDIFLSSNYLIGILVFLRMIMSFGKFQGALIALSLGSSNANNVLKILSPVLNSSDSPEEEEKGFSFSIKEDSTDSIVLRNLFIGWNEESKILVPDTTISKGEICLVIGPSGSGKTTLMRTISTSLTPLSGEIKYDNFDKKCKEEEIFYIRQDPHIIPSTLTENLILDDAENYSNINNISLGDLEAKQMNLLLSFGFSEDRLKELKLSKSINTEISGGEAQRIAILRILFSNKSKLCLFDEPTASLDKENVLLVAQLIKTLAVDKICIVVTHDEYFKELIQESAVKFINLAVI